MKYKKYYTGYLADSYEIDINCDYKGKNFSIIFEETQKCDNIKKHIYDPETKKSTISNTKEVVILTANEINAYDVSKLIFSSITLIIGALNPFKHAASEPLLKEEFELLQNNSHYKDYYSVNCSNIPKACQIACKSSFRKATKYSLIKYFLACKLHCNNFIDLDPSHSEYISLKNYGIDDHIRIGYSIVILYSILEELSIEIRASNNNPSTIKNKWNMKVKNNLEKRLKSIGIDISELIPWNYRSTPTNIERNKKPLKRFQSKWSAYDVRDCFIEIADAIRIISWIRSKIVSHKLHKDIESISIYDCANANNLCREILLQLLD